MLCVEDYLDALKWAGEIGLNGLIRRSQSNLRIIENGLRKRIGSIFLPNPKRRDSNTSVCLTVTSAEVKAMPNEETCEIP